MNRLLDILAKIMSVALYPLFVPTYGIALFCYAYSLHAAPLHPVWVTVAILFTLLLTCILPISAIWIMIKRGVVKDLYIENPGERTLPYLFALVGFASWSYFLWNKLNAPVCINWISIGATVAIGAVAFINRRWKISAHLTGFGGLTGGVLSYCLNIGAIPAWGIVCLWFGLSLALMGARLRLRAHTPEQVSAGWLLGLACTFLPYCIYSYVV